jgi:hypothetical protein
MARHPVGTIRQPLTDTVLFAHIASRLENVGNNDLGAWALGLGLQAGPQAIRGAPRTATRLIGVAAPGRAIRPWALIDYEALNFFMAVARLQIPGGEAVLDRLEQVRGVIDLLCVKENTEIIATVIYERRHEMNALQSVLVEFGKITEWQQVEDSRPTAALSTFRRLAQAAAAAEGLSAADDHRRAE